MYKLQNCEPFIVFKHFEDICRIPHGSGNEKALSDHILKISQDKGLYARQDELYNLIVKIPAAKGFEGAGAVIIQAHLDMVCEKNKSSSHDFENDPIDVYADGDWVKANGTTLGADNGIGVAYCIALIEMAGTEGFEHPPIEIVLTTLEEVGLEGATALCTKDLDAKMLINLDTEEEGFLRMGCAGGSKPTLNISVERTAPPAGYVPFLLDIKGLKGGHSGMEIDKMRANANRLMGRILNELIEINEVYLAEISGGLKDNAITREAEATIYIPSNKIEECVKKVTSYSTILKKEYKKTDAGLTVTFEKIEYTGNAMKPSSIKQVASALMLLPYGPLEMNPYFEGIVETSNNIGVVTTRDEMVSITCAVRSNVGSRKEFVKAQINIVAQLVGATVDHRGDYPAWEYQPESRIRDVFAQVYRDMFKKEPSGGIMHAGIECGLFAEKIPGIDMVSYGPDMYDVHTPDEKVSIGSTKRCWEYLLGVLRVLAKN